MHRQGQPTRGPRWLIKGWLRSPSSQLVPIFLQITSPLPRIWNRACPGAVRNSSRRAVSGPAGGTPHDHDHDRSLPCGMSTYHWSFWPPMENTEKSAASEDPALPCTTSVHSEAHLDPRAGSSRLANSRITIALANRELCLFLVFPPMPLLFLGFLFTHAGRYDRKHPSPGRYRCTCSSSSGGYARFLRGFNHAVGLRFSLGVCLCNFAPSSSSLPARAICPWPPRRLEHEPESHDSLLPPLGAGGQPRKSNCTLQLTKSVSALIRVGSQVLNSLPLPSMTVGAVAGGRRGAAYLRDRPVNGRRGWGSRGNSRWLRHPARRPPESFAGRIARPPNLAVKRRGVRASQPAVTVAKYARPAQVPSRRSTSHSSEGRLGHHL